MPNSPQNPYRPSRCNYVYVCKIAADGTFTIGPDTWTVARTGLGVYAITHGLGHTNYVGFRSSVEPSVGSDSLRVRCHDGHSRHIR